MRAHPWGLSPRGQRACRAPRWSVRRVPSPQVVAALQLERGPSPALGDAAQGAQGN